MHRSNLRNILVVDGNLGNIAAAMAEREEVRTYGYTFITATSVKEAADMLRTQPVFAIITVSKVESEGDGRSLALEAVTRGIKSVTVIEEPDDNNLEAWREIISPLRAVGIHIDTGSISMGCKRWSPSKAALIDGDYDMKTTPLQWKPTSGEPLNDLQYVRSWFGVMMGAPRTRPLNFFPGFPRDGDYELQQAHRDSMS
jgi:hypothetical protein